MEVKAATWTGTGEPMWAEIPWGVAIPLAKSSQECPMTNEANQGQRYGGQQQKENPSGQQQPGQKKLNPSSEQGSQGRRRAPGREQGNDPTRRTPGEGQKDEAENERKRA